MPGSTAFTIRMDTVLFWTDAPELVLGRDRFGAVYLCLLTQLDAGGHRYLSIPISSDRLTELRSGRVDLRTVLASPEEATYFRGHIQPGEKTTITLEPIDTVPSDWLPEEGFLLSEFDDEPADDHEVVRQAIERNGAVIVCRVDPAESRGTLSRIGADRLALSIRKFQELVRQSAKAALNAANAAAKKNLSDDSFALQVVAFSQGSFNIHFESKDTADLFGESIVGAAMRTVDTLMGLSSAPVDEVAERLRAHRGAVLAAYHDLLKFVGKQEVPLSYRWAEPALSSSRKGGINIDAARSLASIIEAESTLVVEEKTFVARFTAVQTDKKPYSWTARDEDDHRHSGHVHEESPTVLNDVRIRTQQYVVSCEQRLVTTPSGDPVQKLFLKTVAPVALDV